MSEGGGRREGKKNSRFLSTQTEGFERKEEKHLFLKSRNFFLIKQYNRLPFCVPKDLWMWRKGWEGEREGEVKKKCDAKNKGKNALYFLFDIGMMLFPFFLDDKK